MQKYSYKTLRIARFTVFIIGILIAAIASGALSFSSTLKEVAAQDPGKMTVLAETCSMDRVLQAGNDEGKVQFCLYADGKVYPVVTSESTISEALIENGIELSEEDQLSGGDFSDAPVDGMEITLLRVTKKTVTETESISFKTRYTLDKSLMSGEYIIRSAGKKGSIIRTYSVVYENGREVSRTLVDTARVEPIDEVIAYNIRNAFSNSRGQQVVYSQSISAVATAYIADNRWGNLTASGNPVRLGVIAVDPSVIPLGTKVYVKSEDSAFGDYGFAIAWDTGSSIKGNKIDLFMESYDLSMRWGVRNVTIYILDDQSIDVFALRQGDEVFIS